ncbi:MAG: GNAT family N-acetyltransferase [Chitinophagaceae bacterium]
MKKEYVNLELTGNETDQRFEMNVDGNIAIIEYKRYPGKIALLHTEVPSQLEGKGAATAIIEKTLAYVEKNNLKLIPLCPLVVAYIKRHPEWKRIVDEGVTNI